MTTKPRLQQRSRLFSDPPRPERFQGNRKTPHGGPPAASQYERALLEMLSGWLRYADAVRSHKQCGIGDEDALGNHWTAIASGLFGLIGGDTGRMDSGILHDILCNTLEDEEFDPALI